MYCSNCGQTLKANLNYCNSCGTRVERSELIVSNSSSKPFAVAAAVIGGGGLLGFFPVLKILLESRLDQPAILLMLVAYLVTVFLMFAVLVGHVWKHSGNIRVKGGREDDEYVPPESFRSPITGQLDAAREPGISVTDHTTRTLEQLPLLRERR